MKFGLAQQLRFKGKYISMSPFVAVLVQWGKMHLAKNIYERYGSSLVTIFVKPIGSLSSSISDTKAVTVNYRPCYVPLLTS